MLPFKGNHFDRTFAPYYLFFGIIKKLKYYFFIIRSASFNFDSANKKEFFTKGNAVHGHFWAIRTMYSGCSQAHTGIW